MVRPLLWMTAAFLIGVVLGGYLPGSWPASVILWPSVALLSIALLASFRSFRRWRSPVLILLLMALSGATAAHLATEDLQPPASLLPYFDRPQTLFLAEIAAPMDHRTDKARLTLRLHRAFQDGKLEPVDGRVLLTTTLVAPSPNTQKWLHGDWVLVRLTLKRLQDFKNPGGFDYVRSQAGKEIFARASLPDDRSFVRVQGPSFLAAESATPWPSVQRALDRFRQNGYRWLKGHLSPDAGDFYGSLLLGYRIPAVWSDRLSRAGVIHLLSISGLHLGLVCLGMFWAVCRGIRWACPSLLLNRSDQQFAIWPALLAAVGYALISGLALPTWRSLIMLGLFMGSAFFYRYSDPITALAAAALTIVLLQPSNLNEVSFQLSFLAMLGLFVVYPRLNGAFGWIAGNRARDPNLFVRLLRPFGQAFLASIAASAFVIPAVIHHFHGLSLAGFIANAVLVPLTGFTVLPLGLAALALLTLHESLAIPVLTVGALFLEVCLWLIKWFSDLPWAYCWVGDIDIEQILALYAALAILFSPWPFRRKAALVLCLALLVGGEMALSRHLAAQTGRGTLRVTAIDVGQGTATLVRFPEGQTMLVDGGGFADDSFDIGRLVVAPFLWHESIRRLDYVVLSHDHPDHRNGLRAVLSHFDVGTFWESGVHEGGSGEDGLIRIAAKRHIPVTTLPDLSPEHSVDGCRVRVLSPATGEHAARAFDSLNNASLVLQIDFGETRVLLPGDIDHSVEEQLIQHMRPAGDVLLVAAHHGSATSNSQPFLEAVRPSHIVISCGLDNPFGFPSERLLTWCRTHDVPCFRTDIQGAIEGSSDGHHWRVRSRMGP